MEPLESLRIFSIKKFRGHTKKGTEAHVTVAGLWMQEELVLMTFSQEQCSSLGSSPHSVLFIMTSLTYE